MEPLKWKVEKLFVLCVFVCILMTREGSATLTIEQGRIITLPEHDTDTYPVVGIATVELNTDQDLSYFFDCITDRNNGEGLRWTRETTPRRFIVNYLEGRSRIRLDATGIIKSDLDNYICSDQSSVDVAILNITDSNPAIMVAEERVDVFKYESAELQVNVSGYPVPTESDITWRYPNSSVITSNDVGVTITDGGRRLALSNVTADQAGLYQISVAISQSSATVGIQLEVYVPTAIITQPQAITDALEWNEVKITCVASGTPAPLIEWEREGGVQLPTGIQTSNTMTENTTTNQLLLSMVRYDDRGRYRCIADNMHSSAVISLYADIRVTPTLELRVGGETTMLQTVNDLYVVEDESEITLECFGSGRLEWNSSTGLEIGYDESENIYQSYDPTRDALALTIQNFTSITTDVYTCMTDLTDAHNRPISISVLITSSNPAVIIRSRIHYVIAGNSTVLEARVYVSPSNMAIVRWYHEDRLIDDANEDRYTTSSEGDIYQLEVNSVSESELGKYTIVVTLNGRTVNDTATLSYPEPPSATITPSSAAVNEGEELTLTCEAGGSGALTVSWTMADSNPLPIGVQENGNELFIASATTSHSGTYFCTVSNLAGTSQDEVIVNVFYSPTVVVSYNQLTSTPNQPLYLQFEHGDQGPTILCSADGYLPPTLVWLQENGQGLPHGLFQSIQPNGDVELRWQRAMEFTDSGSYYCRASNRNGNSSATLQILVEIDPSITSVYPFTSVIIGESQTFSYSVPLNYVGSTLVCVASGWPAPEVEWRKDGLPLQISDGVVSVPVPMSATVSARLTWTRYFQSSDAGSYECVVRKPNTAVPLRSQTIQLNARNSTEIEPLMPCSINKQSVFFQIRILGTNCQNLNGVQTVNEFGNELLGIITTECGCQITDNELEVLGSPQCSSRVEGASVFRGQIETDSSTKTEQIFCSLLSWQQRSPLIRIDNQFRAVDSSCSLESSGSLDSQECVAPSSSTFGKTELAAIIGVATFLILLLIVVFLTVCLVCYRYKHRKQLGGVTRVHLDNHTYSRTETFTKFSCNGVGPIRSHSSAGAYATLSPETRDSSPHFQENIVLGHIQNNSSENLIASEGTDSTMHSGRSKLRLPPPKSYEIPVGSQENLASSDLDSSPNIQATNRHNSSTSGYNSNSPVQTTTVPHSSTDDATNPQHQRNDYENTLSTSSFHDSPSPYRVDGNHSHSGSAGSSSPHTMKQALMAQFKSTDVANTKGCVSEGLPPYTSRPSSEQILNIDSDNSSMMFNGAYGGANHHQHPWYQERNLSADSRKAPSTQSAPSPETNTAIERIRPYAMIHNEHIPYHPPNYRVGGGSHGEPNVPPPRQSRDQQESSLSLSQGAPISSTLC